MIQREYDRARALIAESPDLADFEGPKYEQLVAAAEQRLGVTFPPEYRLFLLELGAGSFGGTEVYGVIGDDFDNSGIPDAVWNTLTMRNDDGLAYDLVAFHAVGNGEQLCLRCGGPDHGAVVVFVAGADHDPDKLEVVADDFGSWLCEMVEQELECT